MAGQGAEPAAEEAQQHDGVHPQGDGGGHQHVQRPEPHRQGRLRPGLQRRAQGWPGACFSPIPVNFVPVVAGSFFQNLLTHAKLFAAQTLMSILSFSSFHLKHFELLQVLAALIQFEERFSFFFFC